MDVLLGKLEIVYRRAIEYHHFYAAARAVELQAKLAAMAKLPPIIDGKAEPIPPAAPGREENGGPDPDRPACRPLPTKAGKSRRMPTIGPEFSITPGHNTGGGAFPVRKRSTP